MYVYSLPKALGLISMYMQASPEESPAKFSLNLLWMENNIGLAVDQVYAPVSPSNHLLLFFNHQICALKASGLPVHTELCPAYDTRELDMQNISDLGKASSLWAEIFLNFILTSGSLIE